MQVHCMIWTNPTPTPGPALCPFEKGEAEAIGLGPSERAAASEEHILQHPDSSAGSRTVQPGLDQGNDMLLRNPNVKPT